MPGDQQTNLFQRLKSAKRLPSPPGAALRVLEICRSEEPDLKLLSDVLASDPALSTRILKFANSPAAGLPRRVSSIREAVLLMGVRTVKLAALGFSVVTPESETACRGFDIRQYWSEACATAVIARLIARDIIKCEAEEAFTVGLLAGIGRLALAQGVPETYSKVLDQLGPDRRLVDAELEALGVSHAELGAQLLAEWGLPEVLSEAVRAVAIERSGQETKVQTMARIVAIAQRLAPWFVQQNVTPDQLRCIWETAEKSLGLGSAAWEQFSTTVRAGYEGLAEVLKLRLSAGVSVTDLYAEAQEEATRVGMVAQLERARADQNVEDLRRRATTDALTGVPNRARFDERLDELVKGVARGHAHFGLILFDIDRFKKFNDTHGHQVGDLVLTRVARAAQNTLRDVDLIARYGGEEFAILTPSTGREGTCLVAARARKCIEALLVQVGEARLSVTISLGVSLSEDFPGTLTAAQIIAEADKQLYLSKKSGRNAWSYRGRTAGTAPGAPAGRAPTKAA
jgi:two-component system cell cycle response regulator